MRLTGTFGTRQIMGKYKAAKAKTDAPPQMKPGVPCLVFILMGVLFTAFLMYEVLKNG